MNRADVARQLSLSTSFSTWLDSLEAIGPYAGELDLTPSETLLDRLHICAEDRPAIRDATLQLSGHPAWRWLLERAYHTVRHDVGRTDEDRGLPQLPLELGAPARCFWVVVFLAAVDDIRRWHLAHAIPDDVSWDTLADLGRHIHLYRLRTGFTGLDTIQWMSLHFRGALFGLGRLQFQPHFLLSGPAGPMFWYEGRELDALGPRFVRGAPALGLHIPEAGPLTPDLCADSFARARKFFADHLASDSASESVGANSREADSPREANSRRQAHSPRQADSPREANFPREADSPREAVSRRAGVPSPPTGQFANAIVTCTSWLMDDQLLEYLGPTTNIVRFQQRFHLAPGWRESDTSAFHFVFARTPDAIDTLHPHTSLERAIVSHFKHGRHWGMRTGWLRLEDQR